MLGCEEVFQNFYGNMPNMLKDTLTGIALISLCILASIWLPVIGLFSYISIPMPVIFYRLKLGRKRGAFIPGAALLLTIVAAGGFSNNIFFTCELLFTGFFLGELLSADFSIEKTVLCACAASIGAAFAGIFFFSAISNASIHGLISDYVSGNIEFTLSLLNSMEMPEESRMELKNAFENLRFLLIRILPALSLISVLFVVWINIVIMRPLLKLKGIRHTNFGSLNKWKAPELRFCMDRHRMRTCNVCSRRLEKLNKNFMLKLPAGIYYDLFFSGNRRYFIFFRKKTIFPDFQNFCFQHHRSMADALSGGGRDRFFRSVDKFQKTGDRGIDKSCLNCSFSKAPQKMSCLLGKRH